MHTTTGMMKRKSQGKVLADTLLSGKVKRIEAAYPEKAGYYKI